MIVTETKLEEGSEEQVSPVAYRSTFKQRRAHADFQCYCRWLGCLNEDPGCGYQDADGYPRQADGGCEWFKQWLENVDTAAGGNATLHVVQKCDAPKQFWTNGAPLGHAQCLEVRTLEHLGLEYVTHPSPAAFQLWLAACPSSADRLESKVTLATDLPRCVCCCRWCCVSKTWYGPSKRSIAVTIFSWGLVVCYILIMGNFDLRSSVHAWENSTTP